VGWDVDFRERRKEGGKKRWKRRRAYLSPASQDTLGKESSDLTRWGGREGGRSGGSIEKGRAVRQVGGRGGKRPAVGVRSRDDVHPLLREGGGRGGGGGGGGGRRSVAVLSLLRSPIFFGGNGIGGGRGGGGGREGGVGVVLVGRHVDHGGGVPVVGVVQDHHVLVTGQGGREGGREGGSVDVHVSILPVLSRSFMPSFPPSRRSCVWLTLCTPAIEPRPGHSPPSLLSVSGGSQVK